MKYLNESLEYETDKVSLASTYNSLDVLYLSQGNTQKAIENFSKAVQMAKEGGDFVSSTHCSVGLANAYIDSGEHARAKQLLDDAL